jgi:hypothetical protein
MAMGGLENAGWIDTEASSITGRIPHDQTLNLKNTVSLQLEREIYLAINSGLLDHAE